MKNPPRPRVVLIGLRGVGKSTLAGLLGERLGWPAADLDEAIRQASGRTVREIFVEEGEAGFRRREAEVLRRLMAQTPLVLAGGGGVVLREENRRLLAANALVVWLQADPATLRRRLEADPASLELRPALTNLNGLPELERLAKERDELYRACADLTIETAGRTPDELCTDLLGQVRCWTPSPT